MDHRDQALHRVRLLLEDSEPWARNLLSQPPPRLVDLDRMACSILDALEVVRSVSQGPPPATGERVSRKGLRKERRKGTA
jgi:hypothetical protein